MLVFISQKWQLTLFLIAVYIKINSGYYKGGFELTGGNWFVVSIYIGLVCFTRYCVIFFNKEIEGREVSKLWQEGYFTDPRDSRKYRTVVIGNQTWLAENLNYEAEGGKYYNNDPANGQKYRQLYNWETARKACPPGWHLPSNADWKELARETKSYLGFNKEFGNSCKGDWWSSTELLAVPSKGADSWKIGTLGLTNNGRFWPFSKSLLKYVRCVKD